jgi:hypothetical protein
MSNVVATRKAAVPATAISRERGRISALSVMRGS